MRQAAIAVSVLAILSLFVAPAWGDVIGSRPAKDCSKEKSKVATELVRKGLAPAEAASEVRQMSAADAEYFAANSARIQVAGGLLLEEWILGGIMAGFCIGVGVFLSTQD